jgi:hypothetical protein
VTVSSFHMSNNPLDRLFDRIDSLGSRFPRAFDLSRTPSNRAFQRFARNRPFLGSFLASVLLFVVAFAITSLKTGGTDEQTVAAIWAGAGVVFFLWMFFYNHRHHRHDRDLDSEPSAESNRLTGHQPGEQ